MTYEPSAIVDSLAQDGLLWLYTCSLWPIDALTKSMIYAPSWTTPSTVLFRRVFSVRSVSDSLHTDDVVEFAQQPEARLPDAHDNHRQ
jgi:hypothetical protein